MESHLAPHINHTSVTIITTNSHLYRSNNSGLWGLLLPVQSTVSHWALGRFFSAPPPAFPLLPASRISPLASLITFSSFSHFFWCLVCVRALSRYSSCSLSIRRLCRRLCGVSTHADPPLASLPRPEPLASLYHQSYYYYLFQLNFFVPLPSPLSLFLSLFSFTHIPADTSQS